MIKSHSDNPHEVADQDPVNLGGAQQMVLELLQLIEAKALAHRLAFRILVQEAALAGGEPQVALRIQAQLDALRWDPAMVNDSESAVRDAVAQELSSLIEALDAVVEAS